MKKIIKFAINQETEKIHEESFAIPHELETLYIEIKRSEECCYSCYMGFILLWDETGAIRLQKLLGYGEQKLAVGLDGMHTTIGGVPGKISVGNWKISLGIFEEYVKQNLEGKEATIEVVITDEISEITEPIGEHIWVEEGKVKISPQKYDWNKVYQREEKWYKGDFHTHT